MFNVVSPFSISGVDNKCGWCDGLITGEFIWVQGKSVKG